MCGIAGYFGPEPSAHEPTVRAMVAALAHRGPDAEGVWTGRGCVLGHRRLKVIDMTDRSAQPMALPDGSACLCYNGEVYNFAHLRAQLESLGHRFESAGDTEVVLRGWRQWGPALPEKLDGMFAFALYDAAEGSLFLVRDRLGIKPLCYVIAGGGLFFASEMRALIRAPIPRVLDISAVEAFFHFQQIPAPMAVFRDVHKLEPGRILKVDKELNVENRTYWSLTDPSDTPGARNEAQALSKLEELLAEAVRKRMVADVPLGAFLSGGVDSSLIAALMARETSDVRTFSIGYVESEYDETDYARRVADKIGSKHTAFVVEQDAASVIRDLCAHWGEPFGDSSVIPTYYVSRQTREHVTVALSGDGSDEALLGYHRHTAEMNGRWLRALPRPLLRAALAVLRTVPGPTRARAEELRPFLCRDDATRYLFRLLYFDEYERNRLFAEPVAAECNGASIRTVRALLNRSDGPFPRRLFDYETGFYLPGVILNKTDSMSMLHALEVRVPFCDHRLMEYFHGLPIDLKHHNGTGKYILKKLAEKFVPRDSIYRKKVGFTAPIRIWMQNGLGAMLRESIESQRAKLSTLLNCDSALELLREHQAARRNHARKLWLLLVFALWSEAHAWEVER